MGYIDADWIGNAVDRKSTSRCCFGMESRVISWYNRKQKPIVSSYAEVEYMAASMEACEAIWLWKFLVELFGQELDPTIIHCDNQSCIKFSKNPVFIDSSKHIDL